MIPEPIPVHASVPLEPPPAHLASIEPAFHEPIEPPSSYHGAPIVLIHHGASLPAGGDDAPMPWPLLVACMAVGIALLMALLFGRRL